MSEFKNASRARHPEILPVTRAVSGTAAIVTTPLRSLVTMAASSVARRTPGLRLACGPQTRCRCGPAVRCHLPPGAHRRRRWRPRPWLRELEKARFAVASEAWGLWGQLTGGLGADGRHGKLRQTGTSATLTPHRCSFHGWKIGERVAPAGLV